jgi:hypothetical protein
MKTIILALITFLSFDSISQTVTPKPIYNGAQRLTIVEIAEGGGRIHFMFQNPDYKTVIDIVSFTVSSKTEAIELIEKVQFILAMEKTDKDQDIRDDFSGVKLTRYGFNQKEVYLGKGLKLNLKLCNEIKLALEKYQYSHEINK